MQKSRTHNTWSNSTIEKAVKDDNSKNIEYFPKHEVID